jgi:hypothetical protein
MGTGDPRTQRNKLGTSWRFPPTGQGRVLVVKIVAGGKINLRAFSCGTHLAVCDWNGVLKEEIEEIGALQGREPAIWREQGGSATGLGGAGVRALFAKLNRGVARLTLFERPEDCDAFLRVREDV